jgi:serine/threonine protein kinase
MCCVSKVPFIQRVRSNVAKWFGSRSKDKESRKRTSSTRDLNSLTLTLVARVGLLNPNSRVGKTMECPRVVNLRNDDELVYEDIDDELYDLLRRLLTKDPIKRITFKVILLIGSLVNRRLSRSYSSSSISS